MSYLGELREHWRALAAASLGLGAGYSLIQYTANLFTPHLMKEFDWSSAQLALVGSVAMLAVICQPIGGRLTDRFGVRKVAAIGVLAAPALIVAITAMSGAISQYVWLSIALVIIVGGTTSATIYSRLIAQRFGRARGAALAIAACAPAALAAAGIPALTRLMEAQGWRAGYIAVACCMGVLGLAALLLIPKDVTTGEKKLACPADKAPPAYREILKNPAFPIILLSMFLCNVAFTLQTTQLSVVLQGLSADASTTALAVSLFATGVITGRLLCGVALDKFPPHLVACVSMSLPAIGLLILLSGTTATLPIAVAALVLGTGVGAEGDIMAYLVMRYFKLEVYSTVLGIVVGTIALSIALGALGLSYTLSLRAGSYDLFLVLASISIVLGSALLLRLKHVPTIK